jgi:GNAT superfamily N-acetyltransferase
MIRKGPITDLPAITRIRTSVTENHLSVEQMAQIGITHDTLGGMMQSGALGCWVAEDDGKIAGFAMAHRGDGEIFALFLDREHEGKGYGSALLNACETWLRQNGVAVASLATDPATRAFSFYQRRGWQPTGETAGHFATDAILTKRL